MYSWLQILERQEVMPLESPSYLHLVFPSISSFLYFVLCLLVLQRVLRHVVFERGDGWDQMKYYNVMFCVYVFGGVRKYTFLNQLYYSILLKQGLWLFFSLVYNLEVLEKFRRFRYGEILENDTRRFSSFWDGWRDGKKEVRKLRNNYRPLFRLFDLHYCRVFKFSPFFTQV